MSGAGWFITLGIIYLVLLVVLAVLSFRATPVQVAVGRGAFGRHERPGRQRPPGRSRLSDAPVR